MAGGAERFIVACAMASHLYGIREKGNIGRACRGPCMLDVTRRDSTEGIIDAWMPRSSLRQMCGESKTAAPEWTLPTRQAPLAGTLISKGLHRSNFNGRPTAT